MFFALAGIFNDADVFGGIFGRCQANVFAVSRGDKLCGAAAAHGENGAQLLHYADII